MIFCSKVFSDFIKVFSHSGNYLEMLKDLALSWSVINCLWCIKSQVIKFIILIYFKRECRRIIFTDWRHKMLLYFDFSLQITELKLCRRAVTESEPITQVSAQRSVATEWTAQLSHFLFCSWLLRTRQKFCKSCSCVFAPQIWQYCWHCIKNTC